MKRPKRTPFGDMLKEQRDGWAEPDKEPFHPTEGVAKPGFVKVWRTIAETRFWCAESTAVERDAFMQILLRVCWGEWEHKKLGTIPAGSLKTSISNLSKEIGCHPDTLRGALCKLQGAGWIKVTSLKGYGTLIAIPSWHWFQVEKQA